MEVMARKWKSREKRTLKKQLFKPTFGVPLGQIKFNGYQGGAKVTGCSTCKTIAYVT
ncbi:hypothetical protein DPMN_086875 [Dreissena polymorpha]|uniref:Uncharacterized protein n=1 Tax=Dreissena polymorpha TaxID=45954 RepID=A0A9D4KT45_DREPO|nr:hypothetical protein DPMN_086875 [Dreissena polymorpha]